MREGKVRAVIDWERIEAEYRKGLLSVREIATANGISHTAIQNRAKSQGWDRDLSAKIKAKAEALVARRHVASQVANKVASGKMATERQLVDAGAETIASIYMSQRADIGKGRALLTSLFGELVTQTDCQADFQKLGEFLASGDDEKLNEIYRKVISLPGRIDGTKKLSEAMKNLIALEREAYGITPETQKIEATLKNPDGTAVQMHPSDAYKAMLGK